MTSYTATAGEDADFAINPPSYTKMDARGNFLADNATNWAMVRDNVTGLIWEVKTTDGLIHDAGDAYTFQDALAVMVADLNADAFGGFEDWRLPTPEELSSIVSRASIDPAVNTSFFPNTTAAGYWTGMGSAQSDVLAWLVDFGAGDVETAFKTGLLRVRAVRGALQSENQFTDNGDGTVTDRRTGLMWQLGDQASLTWEQALADAEAAILGGYDN